VYDNFSADFLNPLTMHKKKRVKLLGYHNNDNFSATTTYSTKRKLYGSNKALVVVKTSTN